MPAGASIATPVVRTRVPDEMARAPRTFAPSRNFIIATAVAAVGILAITSLVTRGYLADAPDAAVVQTPGTPGTPGTPRMVFAEFGLNEDQIYTAPADAPEHRTLHTSVPHAPGWGINPGVSASGSMVAYTVLPVSYTHLTLPTIYSV